MACAVPPAGYKLVPVASQAAARRFQAGVHLDESSYSAAALELQISELRTDFEELYNEALWRETRAWALVPEGSSSVTGSGAPAAEDAWAGLVGIRPATLDGPRSEGYLGFLAVARQHRRRGLGEVLLTHALNAAARAGFAHVRLVSLRCLYAAAVRLYDRAGFVSEQERHYKGEVTGLGEWVFDVCDLRLDMHRWAGALAPPGAAPPQAVITRALPQGPFEWPGRAARIREALADAAPSPGPCGRA